MSLEVVFSTSVMRSSLNVYSPVDFHFVAFDFTFHWKSETSKDKALFINNRFHSVMQVLPLNMNK